MIQDMINSKTVCIASVSLEVGMKKKSQFSLERCGCCFITISQLRIIRVLQVKQVSSGVQADKTSMMFVLMRSWNLNVYAF